MKGRTGQTYQEPVKQNTQLDFIQELVSSPGFNYYDYLDELKEKDTLARLGNSYYKGWHLQLWSDIYNYLNDVEDPAINLQHLRGSNRAQRLVDK